MKESSIRNMEEGPIHSANRVAPNLGADLSDRHLPFLHLAYVLDARHSTEVGHGIG